MKPGLSPTVHLFVCENARPDTGLGPGCGRAGELVTAKLKSEVARHGLVRDVWVTRTYCLGLCPKSGTSVAVYPEGALFTEVHPDDAGALFARAVRGPAEGRRS
jgi:(2Fe-2S) ferredoxin